MRFSPKHAVSTGPRPSPTSSSSNSLHTRPSRLRVREPNNTDTRRRRPGVPRHRRAGERARALRCPRRSRPSRGDLGLFRPARARNEVTAPSDGRAPGHRPADADRLTSGAVSSPAGGVRRVVLPRRHHGRGRNVRTHSTWSMRRDVPDDQPQLAHPPLHRATPWRRNDEDHATVHRQDQPDGRKHERHG